jgi:hypothetical protein
MLKKEIIKMYNDKENNNNIEENTFLMETYPIQIDIEKIKKVYPSSKKLILEIMSNKTSDNFISIEIDPYGYIDSKREKKDGITYL